MELTSQNVFTVFTDCLFKEGEDTTMHVKVEGIMSTFGLHPNRLESHKEDIRSMLDQLPDDFKQEHGGGMSFLNACNTKDGNQWGEHTNMEQLFVLGIGIGFAKYCMPRTAWIAFPGGMPYIVVDTAPDS